jgi:F-type H+-transporting ATPase subunit epsilon
MENEAMHLKITLPHQILLQQEEVLRIVIETTQGSIGLLPRRLDCVLTLQPGIMLYETAVDGEQYLALDTGVLVKCGSLVSVAVRRAISGVAFEDLEQAVRRDFLNVDEHEQSVRTALQRLESGFIRRFMELKRHE